MPLTPITDYAARMLLPLQLVGDERVTPYLRQVLAPQLQQIEDTVALLKARLGLEHATGDLLDKLGAIVGQTRLFDESDATYRRKVKARMARNRSKGKQADLELVAELIVGPSKFIRATFWPSWPCGFGMAIYVSTLLTADEKAIVTEFLKGTRAAGYGMNLAQFVAPVFALSENTAGYVGGVDVGHLADFFHTDP
jgi:hypothetical protein